MTDLARHPDTEMVLLDLSLPDQEGLALLHALESAGLPIPVVVISSREDEEAVRAAEMAGASGFLYKSADTPVLLRALQQIRAGHTCFPVSVNRRAGPALHLTERQRQVLGLLAGGLPNKAICRVLSLSEHTVKSHLKTIFAALEVHNRTECVQVARQLGLVD
jgi:DNA-binding NarL/FixJ family response regulator